MNAYLFHCPKHDERETFSWFIHHWMDVVTHLSFHRRDCTGVCACVPLARETCQTCLSLPAAAQQHVEWSNTCTAQWLCWLCTGSPPSALLPWVMPMPCSGRSSESFCVMPSHEAPLCQYRKMHSEHQRQSAPGQQNNISVQLQCFVFIGSHRFGEQTFHRYLVTSSKLNHIH